MNPDRTDRHLIIQKAISLFSKNGYHQTTMDDIAKACQLQKSSLYHHIPSRKALAIMVIEQTLNYCKTNHFNLAYATDISPQERLKQLAESALIFFSSDTQSSLITNMAVEISETVPEVKELISIYFKEWVVAIASILKQFYPTEQANSLAEDMVAQIHGAILLKKITQDPSPLQRATQRLIDLGIIDSK